MKNHHFIIVLVILDLIIIGFLHKSPEIYTESDGGGYYIPMYASKEGEIEPKNIDSPIPMKDRILNKTGSQCVWSSIETLGKWVKEPKLENLTNRPECRSNASIKQVTDILNKLDIKFEQSYGDEKAGIDLIKKSMAMKVGCLWNTATHTMVMVHYDESENVVKFIDNSDSTLKVQSITIQRFHELWDSWVLFIHPPRDVPLPLE